MSTQARPTGNGYRDPDSFDVRSSVESIRNAVRLHKPLVMATTALTVGLITAYIIMWPPVYECTAMIMVERDADPVRDTFYVGWNVFRKDDARTEIELMTSAPVLLEVIQTEKLSYDDVYHPFLSHATYLWQKSWPGRNYRAMKRKFFGGEAAVDVDPKELEKIRTAVDMRAGITVEPIAESNAGRVTVKGPSRRVSRIANRLVDTYMARRVDRHYDEARRSYDVLTSQMLEAKAALKELEQRRLAFLQANGLTFDFQKESLEVSKLSDLENNISTTTSRIASMEASLYQVDHALAQQPNTLTVSTVYETNAIRESTKMKRRELELQLIQTQERYQPDSPEVTELREELAQLDKLIASSSERVEKGATEGLNAVAQDLVQKRNELVAELAGARASLIMMRETASRMRSRLSGVPAMQAELRAIDREYGLAQEKYQQVLSKQTQSSVSLTTTKIAMPSMRVVEYAMPPQDKAQPKPKILYPAGIVAGLLVGIFAALLRTYAGARLRRDQIEGGRGAAPFYGTVAIGPAPMPITLASRSRSKTQATNG